MPWVLTPAPGKIKAIFTDTDGTTFSYISPVPSNATEGTAFARAAVQGRQAWRARKTAVIAAITRLATAMTAAGEAATAGTDLSGQNESQDG